MTTYRIGQERRTSRATSSMDSRFNTARGNYDGKLHALAPDQVREDGDRLGTAVCERQEPVQLSGEHEFDPTMLVDVGICPRCSRIVANG